MNRNDRVRLRHLADALDAAIRFVRGRERSNLDSDEMLLFALVRAIEIAGEAASKVTGDLRITSSCRLQFASAATTVLNSGQTNPGAFGGQPWPNEPDDDNANFGQTNRIPEHVPKWLSRILCRHARTLGSSPRTGMFPGIRVASQARRGWPGRSRAMMSRVGRWNWKTLQEKLKGCAASWPNEPD